jgi:hypothetical protein
MAGVQRAPREAAYVAELSLKFPGRREQIEELLEVTAPSVGIIAAPAIFVYVLSGHTHLYPFTFTLRAHMHSATHPRAHTSHPHTRPEAQLTDTVCGTTPRHLTSSLVPSLLTRFAQPSLHGSSSLSADGTNKGTVRLRPAKPPSSLR